MQYCTRIAFLLGISGIFLCDVLPWLSWVAIAGISLGYLLTLVKEWLVTRKVKVLSILLCILAIAWIVLQEAINWKYSGVFGQMVVYGFLLQSGWNILGKWNSNLAIFAGISIILNLFQTMYRTTWGNWLVLGMQILVLLKFLDPIFEKIALEHRRKRLEVEKAE